MIGQFHQKYLLLLTEKSINRIEDFLDNLYPQNSLTRIFTTAKTELKINDEVEIKVWSVRRFVAELISMSTPQMNYVNENSQSNMKEQRRGKNNNK